jgi:drug/metabolite transporter (DMT)-like permease
MFALATAGCLWGTGFFFGKIALSEMPVATMVLFRFAFASAGLLPIIFWDRRHFAGTEWGWVFAASVLGVPVSYLVTFKGLSLTTVSHASLMVGTLPMLLAIAAVVFSGERLHLGGCAAEFVMFLIYSRKAWIAHDGESVWMQELWCASSGSLVLWR